MKMRKVLPLLISADARQIFTNRSTQYNHTGKVAGVGYHTEFKARVGRFIADHVAPDFSLHPEANAVALELLKAGLHRNTLGNWVKKFGGKSTFILDYSGKSSPELLRAA